MDKNKKQTATLAEFRMCCKTYASPVHIENRTRSTLNQTGHHRFKNQLPLKAIWKVFKPLSQTTKPKYNVTQRILRSDRTQKQHNHHNSPFSKLAEIWVRVATTKLLGIVWRDRTEVNKHVAL